jgi:hypothetical protein
LEYQQCTSSSELGQELSADQLHHFPISFEQLLIQYKKIDKANLKRNRSVINMNAMVEGLE